MGAQWANGMRECDQRESVQAFSYSFEVNLIHACVSFVTDVFNVISIASILPTILKIIACALVPFYTKISDVVSRAQALAIAMALYLIGYIFQGASKTLLNSTKIIDRGIMFALYDVFATQQAMKPLVAEDADWHTIYIVVGTVAAAGFPIRLVPLWYLRRKSDRAHIGKTGQQVIRKDIRWLLTEFDAMGALLTTTLLPIITVRSFKGNWKNPTVIGVLCGGIAVLALLVIWQAKFSTRPILLMRIWAKRTCFGGLAVTFSLTVMNAFNHQYLSTHLVVSWGIEWDHAALLQRGYLVIHPIAELTAGLVMKRFNTCHLFTWADITIDLIGLALFIPARQSTSSDAFVVISQVITGAASGMVYVSATVAITGAVAKDDVATVIGATQILDSFGYAFGAALSVAMCMAVFVCVATASMKHVDLHEYDDTERTNAVSLEEAEAKR
ncbi:hypothetical protein BG000_003657 [Podila horticola]|nr:hypothetical protein BG000_003657 [Podila horticola]